MTNHGCRCNRLWLYVVYCSIIFVFNSACFLEFVTLFVLELVYHHNFCSELGPGAIIAVVILCDNVNCCRCPHPVNVLPALQPSQPSRRPKKSLPKPHRFDKCFGFEPDCKQKNIFYHCLVLFLDIIF